MEQQELLSIHPFLQEILLLCLKSLKSFIETHLSQSEQKRNIQIKLQIRDFNRLQEHTDFYLFRNTFLPISKDGNWGGGL